MSPNSLSNIIIYLFFLAAIFACENDGIIPDQEKPNPIVSDSIDYSGIPQSDIYEIKVISGDDISKQIVFQSECPEYNPGYMGMEEKDQYPIGIFSGRSINWVNFSFEGQVTVEVKVLNKSKVPLSSDVRVFPSRHNVSPTIQGDVIRFVLNQPGQYSLEIGENGYKNGLMIFANPTETEIPDTTLGQYKVLNRGDIYAIQGVESTYSGIYFKKGIHDIGIFNVPAHIKNIYFEEGAWVYGAIILDGKPYVRIFGRGVLSGAKLDYREAHSVEAINNSDYIHLEGLVIADFKHFAVRLIGRSNTVKWIKTIGGWVYNCDGIAAFGGSEVSNCFVWANDDAIKVYRSGISWTDCVVWQLNNGGIIQMGWTAPNSSNVTIKRIDVLRAEWNKPGFNRGLLNYVGNRYNEPDKSGYHSKWLIEDIVTETAIPVIFNITPDIFAKNPINGLVMRNWNVKMKMGTNFQNKIIGNDPDNYFEGLVFDNVVFNNIKLEESNWQDVTKMEYVNAETPFFNP